MGSEAGIALRKAVDRRWLILVPYGAVYLGCTALMGIEQAGGLVRRVLRKSAINAQKLICR